MTFKKGDKVVCVNDSVTGGHGKIPEVTKGKEYTVYSPGGTVKFVNIMGTDNLPYSPQSLYSSRFKLVEEKADCYIINERGESCTIKMTEQQCTDWINARKVPGTYTILREVKKFKIEAAITVTEI